MGNVCNWLLAKRIVLFEYINAAENPVNSAPPDWWWIVIAGISALTDLINSVFVKLQSPNLLLSTQSALLDTLSTDICMMIGIRGPFSVQEIGDVAGEFSVIYGRWYVDYAEIVTFIEGLGMHSRHTLQTLEDELHRKVLHSTGHLTTRIVKGIDCQHSGGKKRTKQCRQRLATCIAS